MPNEFEDNDYSNIDDVIKEIESKASDIQADMEIDKKKQLDRFDMAGHALWEQIQNVENQLIGILPQVMFKRNDKTITDEEWDRFKNNARYFAMHLRDEESLSHYKWLNNEKLDGTTFRVDPCFIPVPNIPEEIGPDLIKRFWEARVLIIDELFEFMDEYYEETKQPFTKNMLLNLFSSYSEIAQEFFGIHTILIIEPIVDSIMDYKIKHSQVDHKITEYDNLGCWLEYYNAGIHHIETDDGPICLQCMFGEEPDEDCGEGSEEPAWENIPGTMMFGVGTVDDD